MIRNISAETSRLTSGIMLILFIFLTSTQAVAAEWLPVKPGMQPTEPSVFLVEDTPDHLLIRWELQGAFVNEIEIYGDKYDQIYLKNLMQVYNGAPGDPALPMLIEVIHVPNGMKGKVDLIEAEWVDLTTGIIIPKQHPARDDGSTPPPFVINEESYAQKDPFPANLTSTNPPQGWGGIAVSSVAVTPIRYFPAENKIQLATSITIRVNFEPGIQNIVVPRRINPQMRKLHQIALLNPPDDIPQPLDADENKVVRMLFIMKEEALETTQPLIDFHHQTGLRTDIIFIDDLPDDDEDAAAVLKDLIRERYEEGVEFVQLIGDPDSNRWDVPMHHWDPEDPGAQDNNTDTHSDSWYICLDGPGEFGFEDHLPELAIGRLTYRSVDDLDELEIQVAKLVDYLWWDFEERDEGGWLNRAVLVGNDANVPGFDPAQEYLRCKRAIENFDYELDAPEFITQYGNENNVSNATMIDIVNTGVGFFNYRGHGDVTSMRNWNRNNQSIRVTQVRQMENRNRPFILVSSACLNASIVERDSNTLLESFQKQSGGSVSAHGSIISSYTVSNSFFDEAIYQAFFDEGVFTLGYSSNLAATIMVLHFDQPFDRPNVYNSLGRMNFRTYIWLGDPALQYRLGEPLTLVVGIPEVILIDTEFIDVTVLDPEDDPIENTRICVRSDDDAIYQVAVTDANGAARIVFDPGMEEARELFWAAQHRNGELVEGDIVVADGFGRIEGRVLDLGTEDAIPAAELLLTPFNVLAVSNNEGRYFFEGIPERQNYSVTVSAEGYLSLQQEGINVIDDEVTEVDFLLAYSELTVSEEEIEFAIIAGENAETTLIMTNTGTGTLTWTSWLTDEYDREEYEVIANEEQSLELDDTSLNGILLIGDHYYLSGGNNLQDPNYIYKVDLDGRLVNQFEQPRAAAGIGMHDLATDGEYIYGSARDIIYQLNLDGEVVSEIDGPYNPNVALTLDGDGNIWVGNNRSPLVKIDLEGNVLQEIQNSQRVRALAWSPVDENGFHLKMMVFGEDNAPTMYHANPETEEVRLAHNLPQVEAGESPGDGLYITNEYNPPAWSVIGIIKYDILRYMRVWHLYYNAIWIEYEPDQGTLQPDDDETITLRFDAAELEAGTSLNAILGLECDGREPLVEIPITLDIVLSVDLDNGAVIPTEFEIAGAYPNPFNAFTNIVFNLPVASYVVGSVFDLQGRNIHSFVEGNMQAGVHTLLLDGNSLSTGVYIVKIKAGNDVSTRKIVLLK